MKELLKNNVNIAFGRVATDYFMGCDRADYADITEEMARAARPERFKPHLFNAASANAVGGVVLSSAEYGRLVRYPRAFESAVSNRTFTSRGLDNDVSRRNNTATQGGIKALESKIPKLKNTLAGIRSEQSNIELLSKEASHAGFAHIPAQDMLIAATTVNTFIFGRILEVVSREKSWSEEKAQMARRSLDVRLFLGVGDGDVGLNSRVGNWEGMLGLAHEYGAAREQLFAGRIAEVSQRIGEYAVAHSND